jgi:hypothetical protein
MGPTVIADIRGDNSAPYDAEFNYGLSGELTFHNSNLDACLYWILSNLHATVQLNNIIKEQRNILFNTALYETY